MDNKDKNDIFPEVETITNRQSYLPVILIIGFVFIILEIGAFWLSGFLPKKIDSLSLSKNVDIKEKVDLSKKDQPVQITVTEEEINSQLKQSNLPIYNPKVSILPDAIALEGRSSKNILSLRLKVKIVPKVENNKIVLDVVSFEGEGIEAPQSLIDKATPEINKEFQNFLNLPSNFALSDIRLFKGYLVIFGEVL